MTQDMGEATVYLTLENKEKAITDHQILNQLLFGPDESKVSSAPAKLPKAGEVYVYDLKKLPHWTDIRCDRYGSWVHDGMKTFPPTKPFGERRYYNIAAKGMQRGSQAFRRIEVLAYGTEDRKYAVVQYIGDENAFQGHVHGNALGAETRLFVRQSASVKNQILKEPKEKPAATVYMEMTAENTQDDVVYAPRNPKKVQNSLDISRSQARLSHDELYNVSELWYDLSPFITYFRQFPTLSLHLFNSGVADLTEDIFKSDKMFPDFYFAYDTTFQLGNFYVSVLSCRFPLFEGSPTIPIAYHIHERKFSKDHLYFLQEVFQALKSTKWKRDLPFVSDREFFVDIPGVVQVYCWNHLKRDARDFILYTKKSTKEQADFYSNQVENLLKASSEEQYGRKFEELSNRWSKPFLEYYEANLREPIVSHSVRWRLEALGIYDLTSGITSNCAESVNALLKRLMCWKERPLDVVVYSLYQLGSFHRKEIIRGKHGLGKWKLRAGMTALPSEEMPKMPVLLKPEDIVSNIRDRQLMPPPERQMHVPTTDPSPSSNDNDALVDEAPNVTASANSTFNDEFSGHVSASMAQRVIDERRITLVPEQQAFIVEGSNGNKYPRKSGRKRKADVDYDVAAAPDSIEEQTGVQIRFQKPELAALFPSSMPGASTDASAPVTQPCASPVSQDVTNKPIAAEKSPADIEKEAEASVDQCIESWSRDLTPLTAPVPIHPPNLDIAEFQEPIPYSELQKIPIATDRKLNLPILLPWGPTEANIVNTCPVDNPLSIFYLASLVSESFWDSLSRGMTAPERALTELLKLTREQRYVEAKKVWCRVVDKGTEKYSERYNMYGDEMDLIVDQLSVAYTAHGLDECSNSETCPKPTRYEETSFLCIDPFDDVQTQVDQKFYDHSPECGETMTLTAQNRGCSKVRKIEDLITGFMVSNRECNGTRRVTDISLRSGGTLWFFPLGLNIVKWSIEESFKLPRLLDVMGNVLHLRGFSVNEASRDHFTAYVLWQGKFYYYDGFNRGSLTEEFPMRGDPYIAYYTK